MKLLEEFRKQVHGLGNIKHAWFTTFTFGIPFFETHVLSALLGEDVPVKRMDYESMQQRLADRGIDVRVFCDLRMMQTDQLKRTALPVHGILPAQLMHDENSNKFDELSKESLFHPKAIFLEDVNGQMVLGAGSANLGIDGWGRNQEAFTFRKVSTKKQYEQIQKFFAPLLIAAGLSPKETFRKTMRPHGDDESWRFAHSFDAQSFLELLFEDPCANRLTVWSPYFSKDIAGFLKKIDEIDDLAKRELTFAIVPDLVGNEKMRTVWTEGVRAMHAEGKLSFHSQPSKPARDESVKMVHAKLWLASAEESSPDGKATLAVGSWNCTSRGSASFDLCNVEAGILLSVPNETDIKGNKLKFDEKIFSTEQMLEDDALDVTEYPLPFLLQVSFDWKQGYYQVDGQLLGTNKDNSLLGAYTLLLPGVQEHLKLSWSKRKAEWPQTPLKKCVADNQALLANHCYEVWCNGNMECRGLVQETEQIYRQAQAYDSLTDILNDWSNEVPPDASTTSRLREVLRHDDVPDDEPVRASIDGSGAGMSYFRLFNAFEQFRKRIRATKSVDELEKLLFFCPGSLQELVAKVANENEKTVFNWFLQQEAETLLVEAKEAYRNMPREKYARKEPPENERWASLSLPLSKLEGTPLPKKKANTKYMQELRKMCNYGR